MRYSNRSNPSPSPFLPLIDQGHPPPPSRWLEPNNRELILLFESYLVDVFLYFAPLRLFTPLFEGPIQTPSPPLFFVSSFDSFPRLFHSVRFDLERERETSASWPAVLVRAQILLLRSNDIQASSLHPCKFDIPVEGLVVVRGNFRRNETRCSLYHFGRFRKFSTRLVSENNVQDTKFHVAWNSILVKACFEFVFEQISNTISF